MALGVYLRSSVALAWTLLGAAVVGGLAVAGWLAASFVRARAAAAGPGFLIGLGDLLYLVVVFVLAALVAVAWLPFGAGVAYAVGRRTRDQPAAFRASVTAVLDGAAALARWVKTRVAVPGLAEYVLTEEDVAPTEVVTGCEPYVVPAVVLDSPTGLARAVDRANRVTPRPGRERLWAGALGATLLATGGGYVGGALADLGITPTALAVAVLAVGLAVTAALDAAWRAETYASQDLDEGFRR
ncbi:hypothetical protein [Natronomonas marina]|jgi:hypothetical protein|uniref:hypothetical protein n=1 Tax=Natronomonas marina TaxID=2961939 RepID=UPI0020C9756A|nr:hypothetical protein [Natronomonas marina]